MKNKELNEEKTFYIIIWVVIYACAFYIGYNYGAKLALAVVVLSYFMSIESKYAKE